MSNSPQKAAALYRRSDKTQGNSIKRQQETVRPYAERKGGDIVAEYVFDGIPGDEMTDTAEWQRLLRDAQAVKWTVLFADEPSRLSRDDYDDFVADVKRPLKRAGVIVDTVSEGVQDWETLSGDILSLLSAHKAAKETRDLSRRVLSDHATRAKEGKYFGWICPYGLRKIYYVDPETGKRKCLGVEFGPDEEVRTVLFIFDCVANRRWSLCRICRELEARGVKPPKGNGHGKNKAEGRWNPRTVQKMISNRKYVGDLPWNETHQGKHYEWVGGNAGKAEKRKPRTTRVKRHGPEDVILRTDEIPAIVDRETFGRANAVLKDNKKVTTSKEGDDSYLFTRLLVCGDCGSFLRGQPCRGGKGYICAKYKTYGKDACHRNSILEKHAWQAVLDQVQNVILDPARLNAIEAEIERRLAKERGDGTAKSLQKEIDALGKAIAQGERNLLLIAPEHLKGAESQLALLKADRDSKQAKLNELETGVSQHKAILAEAKKQLWRLREALEGDDAELQTAVIREVISKVEVKYHHERTHGKRSKDGQGRLKSVPNRLLLSVRPGLGISLLCTSCYRNQAHDGASARANSCRLVCVIPD